MKWEYKTLYWKDKITLENILNEYGLYKWELVAVVPYALDNYNHLLFFKRLLPSH